jgi:hypothetical protein
LNTASPQETIAILDFLNKSVEILQALEVDIIIKKRLLVVVFAELLDKCPRLYGLLTQKFGDHPCGLYRYEISEQIISTFLKMLPTEELASVLIFCRDWL